MIEVVTLMAVVAAAIDVSAVNMKIEECGEADRMRRCERQWPRRQRRFEAAWRGQIGMDRWQSKTTT